MNEAQDAFVMTRADLARLREMRELQRRWFGDRDKTVIGRAKYLETQVDKWLAQFPPDDETTLFT